MDPYPCVSDLILSLKSTRISFNGRTAVNITRRVSSDSVCSTSPRFSMMSCIMSPIFSFAHNEAFYDRLANFFNHAWIRQERWVVDLHKLPVRLQDMVDHAWIGRDDVHVELAPQPLLHYLHVQ